MPINPPEDLSKILKRVIERSEPSRASRRRELANDPTTKEFLAAGLRLLTGEHGEEAENEEGDARRRPFFDWLSVDRVTREAKRSGNHVTENQHRYRWPSRDDYIEDLLAFSLADGHWPSSQATSPEGRAELLEGDFVDGIHEVAYLNLAEISENMAFKVGMIATAMAKDDPLILEASARTYDLLTKTWSQLYAETIEARGFTLRKGITLEEFTMLLTAVADGLSMRMLAQPTAKVIDHDARRSLLGKAALGMAIAFLDPGDGLSVEDLLRLASQEKDAE